MLPGQTYIYPLPPDFIRLKLLWCNVGNYTYIATDVFNEEEWRQYFFSNVSVHSNFLSRVRVRSDTMEIFPIPASSTTMNRLYESRTPDASVDDYIQGTVASLVTTNGVSVVTLNSPASTTAAIVGRFIQFAGDTQWYKIYTWTDATHFNLKTPYIGALSSFSGINYKIGQLPPTPGDTHIIPVYGALALYYSGPKKDANFQKLYQGLYDKNFTRAKATYGNQYSRQVIMPSQQQLRQGLSRNPNYYPSNIGP